MNSPKRVARPNLVCLETRDVPTFYGNNLFPTDNPWNQDISNAPIAANSSTIINTIVARTGTRGIHPDFGNPVTDGALYGIPVNVADSSTPKYSIYIPAEGYAGESDIVQVPIPDNAVLEGDGPTGPNPASDRGDSHLLVYDKTANVLYELFDASRPSETTFSYGGTKPLGVWGAYQVSYWDMNKNSFRTPDFTSADAAGLPILPGLVRPDEALPTAAGGQGAINHAIRVTVAKTQNSYIYPASHWASFSSDSSYPRMGERFRLRSDFVIPNTWTPEAQAVAQAMKTYGLIVADNGSDFFFQGTPSDQWNMDGMLALRAIKPADFQVVNLTPVVTGLSVTSGSTSGGTAVTITGQNFSGAGGQLQVLFGNTPAPAYTIVSDTKINVTTPALAAGAVNVTVQSGTIKPNADGNNIFFGYGTSAVTPAASYTFTTPPVSPPPVSPPPVSPPPVSPPPVSPPPVSPPPVSPPPVSPPPVSPPPVSPPPVSPPPVSPPPVSPPPVSPPPVSPPPVSPPPVSPPPVSPPPVSPPPVSPPPVSPPPVSPPPVSPPPVSPPPVSPPPVSPPPVSPPPVSPPPVSPPPVSPPPVSPPPVSPPPVSPPPVSPPPPPPPPSVSNPFLTGFPQFSVGMDVGNGTAELLNADQSVRFSLQPFPGFKGSIRTSAADFNGDGVADLVVATGPGAPTQVEVIDGATQKILYKAAPFESAFQGGVFVATGDLNHDGTSDLVITPDQGGGPRVRIFDGSTFKQIGDFYGIKDDSFRGGARASLGDINGDGYSDLIVAAGFGGGPRISVYDGKSIATGVPNPKNLFGDFFAFEESLRNGTFVTAGDLNGDGKAELVIGAGPGGGPRVTIFDANSMLQNKKKPIADFFAGDKNNRGGVSVAVKNLDGDGKADLVVGTGRGGSKGNTVTGYTAADILQSPNNPAVDFAFDPFSGQNVNGVYVG